MPAKYELTQEESVLARRTLLMTKIAAERASLLAGGQLISAPAEYRHQPGTTREQRVAAWEEMLSKLGNGSAI